MVTSLLLLVLSQSILVDQSYRLEPLLHDIPSAESYGHLMEHLVQPVILSLEESGGFSDVDPAKISIYGDSWVWSEWYFDGFNLTDPLFPGAAAFTIPFRLLRAFEVVYAENPRTRMRQGIALWSGAGTRAGATIHFPDAGGTTPPARPLADAISTSHAENRTPPPPEERRRFGGAYQLSLVDTQQLALGRLTYAVQIEDASRRFLDFAPNGDFTSVFEETYLVASGTAILQPSPDTRLLLLAEYLERDNAFAELHYASRETFALQTIGLLFGFSYRQLRAALTVKRYRFEPNQLGFTRELFDSDGEALLPFHPPGTYGAAKLEVAHDGELFYFSLVNRLLAFEPSAELWTNPVTAGGEPYGTWTWRSVSNTQAIGDERLGIAERLDFGPVALAYDFHLAVAYVLNNLGDNSVVLADMGVETALELDNLGSYRPFLVFAKTPLSPSTQLAQQLDPRHLDGTFRLDDGRAIDRIGNTGVAPGLQITNIYSLATGVAIQLSKSWNLEMQGILKTYRNTYELVANGDRLLLDNVRRDQPFYYGAHFQLLGIDPEEYVVSVGFSAYNAIGHPPFGNGPLANDIGVIDPSTADPITDVNRLANLDGDRGFHFKALLGYRFFDRLWTFLSIRHRDGQPFAFIDAEEQDGRIELVQSTKRGSPLKIDRPLDGPREDFHLDFTLKVALELAVEPIRLHASLLAANLLDFGNEIQERNGPLRPVGRPALEQQIPRSFLLSIEAAY